MGPRVYGMINAKVVVAVPPPRCGPGHRRPGGWTPVHGRRAAGALSDRPQTRRHRQVPPTPAAGRAPACPAAVRPPGSSLVASRQGCGDAMRDPPAGPQGRQRWRARARPTVAALRSLETPPLPAFAAVSRGRVAAAVLAGEVASVKSLLGTVHLSNKAANVGMVSTALEAGADALDARQRAPRAARQATSTTAALSHAGDEAMLRALLHAVPTKDWAPEDWLQLTERAVAAGRRALLPALHAAASAHVKGRRAFHRRARAHARIREWAIWPHLAMPCCPSTSLPLPSPAPSCPLVDTAQALACPAPP